MESVPQISVVQKSTSLPTPAWMLPVLSNTSMAAADMSTHPTILAKTGYHLFLCQCTKSQTKMGTNLSCAFLTKEVDFDIAEEALNTEGGKVSMRVSPRPSVALKDSFRGSSRRVTSRYVELKDPTPNIRYLSRLMPKSNELLRYNVISRQVDRFVLDDLPFRPWWSSLANYVFLNENDLFFCGEEESL
jgi:hypothetical protein